MTEKIRVLIVDDLPETRQNVSKLLQFEADIEVIGHAGTGQEAIDLAKQHQPDIVLMDINMPGVDGIGASRAITQAVPATQIIIMSVQSEADYLRRAMLAGARDFLMKPFGGEELSGAIRSVYKMRPKIAVQPVYPSQGGAGEAALGARPQRKGNMAAVFSPKGGSGCTTIAINLAVSLAKLGHRTLLLDGRLQFGDVAVMLNMKPTTTILDVIDRISELDAELVDSVALTHASGLKVLLAPPRPEMAELVTNEQMIGLLERLPRFYQYIIIDTSSNLSDISLTILDRSDRILLVAQQNLPSLKNISHFYDLAEGLDYDPNKIMLVINRASNKLGVKFDSIPEFLKRPIVATIPADEPAALTAADRGYPLVSGPSQRRPIALALDRLAEQLVEELAPEPEFVPAEAGKPSRLGRLFGSR